MIVDWVLIALIMSGMYSDGFAIRKTKFNQ